MILTGSSLLVFLTCAVSVSLASYASTTPARHNQCRSVYETVYEPQCTTSYEKDCSTTYSQECTPVTEYSRECSTNYEQQCSTEYAQECRTDYQQTCNTIYEQQCSTQYEQECNTEYKQECSTTYETKCSTSHETVEEHYTTEDHSSYGSRPLQHSTKKQVPVENCWEEPKESCRQVPG